MILRARSNLTPIGVKGDTYSPYYSPVELFSPLIGSSELDEYMLTYKEMQIVGCTIVLHKAGGVQTCTCVDTGNTQHTSCFPAWRSGWVIVSSGQLFMPVTSSSGVPTFNMEHIGFDKMINARYVKKIYPTENTTYASVRCKPYMLMTESGPAGGSGIQWFTKRRPCSRWFPITWLRSGPKIYGPFIAPVNSDGSPLISGGQKDFDTNVIAEFAFKVRFRGQT